MLRLGQLLISFGGCAVLVSVAIASVVGTLMQAAKEWREARPLGVPFILGLGLALSGACLWCAALLWGWPA